MSPWIEAPAAPCQHPGRPRPSAAHLGRHWQCPSCERIWQMRAIDMGHDVQLGEDSVEYRWVSI
jgi:hypothetical protein